MHVINKTNESRRHEESKNRRRIQSINELLYDKLSRSPSRRPPTAQTGGLLRKGPRWRTPAIRVIDVFAVDVLDVRVEGATVFAACVALF